MAETETTSLTSLATSSVPLGSVWPKLTPKSLRSIVVSTSKPARWLPHGSSSAAAATVPVKVIGRVTPLMVISPLRVIAVPVISPAEVKVICGNCAASKKSGDCR
jgi:hypothetical protein